MEKQIKKQFDLKIENNKKSKSHCHMRTKLQPRKQICATCG